MWNTGAELIAEERKRQVEKEGYTAKNDDKQSKRELARAAACYAIDHVNPTQLGFGWPWDRQCWKPTPDDPVRQLVKAGALIAAEIDRLQRLEEEN